MTTLTLSVTGPLDAVPTACLRALASSLFKSCRRLLQSAGSERLVNRLVKVLQAK